MRPWHFFTLLLICSVSSCVRSELAPGVNPEAIKAVQLGMEVGDVIKTLGLPLSVEARLGTHSGNCRIMSRSPKRLITQKEQIRWFVDSSFKASPCCDANRRDREERHFVLVYSGMVALQSESPMLWIHFDRRAQVREVFAKLNGLDDRGVYLLKWEQVRGTTAVDTTKVMYSCDEELLKKYFSP